MSYGRRKPIPAYPVGRNRKDHIKSLLPFRSTMGIRAVNTLSQMFPVISKEASMTSTVKYTIILK